MTVHSTKDREESMSPTVISQFPPTVIIPKFTKATNIYLLLAVADKDRLTKGKRLLSLELTLFEIYCNRQQAIS